MLAEVTLTSSRGPLASIPLSTSLSIFRIIHPHRMQTLRGPFFSHRPPSDNRDIRKVPIFVSPLFSMRSFFSFFLSLTPLLPNRMPSKRLIITIWRSPGSDDIERWSITRMEDLRRPCTKCRRWSAGVEIGDFNDRCGRLERT